MIAKSQRVNMLSGRLAPSMLKFAFPLMISSMLSLLYSMADLVVVGRFSASSDAGMAAISAAAPVGLIINGIVGSMPIGTSVLTAQAIGAGDRDRTHRVVHTGVCFGLLIGVLGAVAAWTLSPTILRLTNAPVQDLANEYIRIVSLTYFTGSITSTATVILAAAGYSRGIMVVSLGSGLLNFLLNLLFVCGFKWDMQGVAWATTLSSALSAVVLLIMLCRSTEIIKLELRKLRLNSRVLSDILKLSLPAVLQNFVLQASNVYVQMSLNSLDNLAGTSFVCAGNIAGANVEGMIHSGIGAVATANLNFVGQNVGAKNYKRVRRVNFTATWLVLLIGGIATVIFAVFAKQILSIYNPKPEVINAGFTRVMYCGIFMFLNVLSDVQLGGLRGLGRSLAPTVVTLVSSVGVRMAWLFFMFEQGVTLPFLYASTGNAPATLATLYFCYPVSYSVSLALGTILFRITLKKDAAASMHQATTLNE